MIDFLVYVGDMMLRFKSWVRLLPAIVWVFVQVWMGTTMASAAPAHQLHAPKSQITVELCGGGGPLTIDLGVEAPAPPPVMAGHECEWCQAFGVTTVPSPASVLGRIGYTSDAKLLLCKESSWHRQVQVAGYLSRAPPV